MSNGQFIGVYAGEGAIYKPFAALFESALFRVPLPWKALDRSDLRNGRLLRHRHQIKALIVPGNSGTSRYRQAWGTAGT